MYVSVTGLRLNGWRHVPLFWRHAMSTMTDARRAPGNISAGVRQVDGVYHTLSSWQSRKDMLNYMRSTRHAKAMRRFADIATGKVYGFETEVLPSWEEALALYHEKGRSIYAPR